MREFKDLKIAVAGTGYVGLSIATLLSQHHKVTAVDIVPEKVELINNKKSPIQDEYIEKYLAEKELNLTATLDAKEAYSDADFVVIAAPTNYDSKKNFFDTSAVEAVIKLVIEYNPEAIMVIKSTIPVGYTASVREKFHCDNIIFSPEFLRESKALYDNLYPSRIIVGTDVVNCIRRNRQTVLAILLVRCFLHHTDNTFHDVIHISKITLAVAIVEDFDSFALHQLVGESEVGHVRATCRTIHGEEAQSSGRNVIELRVGMCHQLIRFLSGCIQRHRIIYLVIRAVRNLLVGTVDGGRRSIHQVL